jgi:hypothetical protein
VSAWTYGASILTFVFPMLLFLTVALTLYVVFTKPSVVPGHGEEAVERPIGFTPRVRMPGHGPSTTGYTPPAGPHYPVGPGGSQATAPGEGRTGEPPAGWRSTEGAE